MTTTDLAQRLRRPARYAWLTVMVLCWSVAIIGQLGRTTPYLEIATHFALQLCWASAMLALAALLLRRWRHALVAIALVLWQTWLIWPSDSLPVVTAETPGVRIRLIEFNTWYFNPHPDDIVAYLRDSKADVIGLVEVSPQMKAALAPLYALYPYHADCLDNDPRCEELLLSRWPIDQVSAGRVDGGLPVVITARLHPATDIAVDIALTHLIRPLTHFHPGPSATFLPATAPTVQSEQAARLATKLAQLGPDAVFLGDLNATPWSPVLKALRRIGSWDAEAVLAPSWPSWGTAPLRLPIDHVLTRGRVVLTGLTTGPVLSSDHLPLEADLFIHGKTPQ